MTPRCQNCDAHVSDRYARVFTPNGVENPRCCPHCPDLVRDEYSQPRRARSDRSGNGEHADDAIAADGGQA